MNSERYKARIRGEYAQDDGLRIDLGTLRPDQAWWQAPLPPCPDRGGGIVWYETGHVPGTRKCVRCGSLFSVETEAGRLILRRAKFY